MQSDAVNLRINAGLLPLAWLVTAGFFFPVMAFAEPGQHIRAGGAVITPAVTLGVEHSTNVYHSDSESTPGTDLTLSPTLQIAAEGAASKKDFGRMMKILSEKLSGKADAKRISELLGRVLK